jgi:predicted HTH transcriptional regulator
VNNLDKQRLIALLQKTEGTKLDFKLQMSLKTDSEKKELTKDVIAMANSKGGRGYIIFGIEDKTKKIIGINDETYREEQIQQIISQRCEPPVAINYDIISLENKAIGVLTIYKSSQKPHQVRQTGAFYIRRGSTTDIARREEIASMFQESGMLYYEKIVVNRASTNDLDNKVINEYFTKTGLINNTDNYFDILEGLGIIGREEDSGKLHPTIGGLLVFGFNPQKFLPNTGIKIIDNFSSCGNIYLTGSIIKMLDDIEKHIGNMILNNSYPMYALAEVVANAAVHRDYFVNQREIVITLSKSKIEVSNPGSLCDEDEEVVLFDENNPCIRNPWLYQRLMILDDKGRFLKTGMGVNRIKQAFKHIGEVKFLNKSKRNLFKVILPGLDHGL